MRLPRPSAARFAPLGLAALLILPGCSSKTPEVDTAVVSPDPTVKVPPSTTPAPAPAPGTPSKP